MDLGQCLSLLTNASSDNEKMAAMLLVAKLIKSGDIGNEGRRKIFTAVGFNFLNRLLATNDIPEGCSDNPYHKIAVTIFACFCTDQELAVHPQVTSKIPVFNNYLLHCSSGESVPIAEDALQCLQGISSSSTGLRHLLRPGLSTLQSLVKCYLNQTKSSDGAKDLILYIVGQSEVRAMESFHTHFSTFMDILAEEFRSNQDELKFKLCSLLHQVLLLCDDTLDAAVGNEWVQVIALGLKDILTSKLDSAHRDPALHLSALLCHLFGLQWVAAAGSQFLLLLVDLFAVETRLAIEGRELTDVSKSSELLCSCFIVLESTIAHMIKSADHKLTESISLTEEDLLHLHTTLIESFTFIILFLKQLESSVMPTFTDAKKTDTHPQLLTTITPLLVACVRVIGAWLAEDNLSLSADILSSLPFLVHLAKFTDSTEAEREGKDLLKFLLPGLSHLTAEDKPRKILIEAGLIDVLLGHMQRLMLEHPDNIEPITERLRLCCEVVINVCVCEPGLIKSSEGISANAAFILKIFTKAPATCAVLRMNALLLFVLIANGIGPEQVTSLTGAPLKDTLISILHYLLFCLSDSPSIRRTKDQDTYWDDISELWFISMQELSRSVVLNPDLVQAVVEGNYVQQLTAVLAHTGELSKGNEQLESITAAICTFLQSVTHQ